jgi:hypothetical protein
VSGGRKARSDGCVCQLEGCANHESWSCERVNDTLIESLDVVLLVLANLRQSWIELPWRSSKRVTSIPCIAFL